MAKNRNMIGSWAFTVGVLIAVVLGAIGGSLGGAAQQWLAVALIVIGIIVGILNVTSDEAMGFLTTSAILVFVSWAGGQTLSALSDAGVLSIFVSIFNAFMVLFVPATIVVALRAVFTLARD